MKTNLVLVLLSFLPILILAQPRKAELNMDDLAIKTSPNQSRDFSYTDKKFGYFYGATHGEPKENWFAGWNLNTKRILKDYEIYTDAGKLERQRAEVTVYPYKVVRKTSECKEELYLFDNKPVLGIRLTEVNGDYIGIKLIGGLDSLEQVADEGLYFIPKEEKDNRILLTTWKKENFEYNNEMLVSSKAAEGFVFLYGKDKNEIRNMLIDFRKNHDAWLKSRYDRMNDLLKKNNYFSSDDKELDKVLKWLLLTTDQLIMNQMGWGIYAGLPWFNDYWGRDLFITFPGACLVTGQFETAKNILLSFAKFQNNDENSKYYGRVPNRARPDEIIYNSTDGTPRLIIEIMDYIHYTGDKSIIPGLYPVIKKAIAGAEKYWLDEKCYLTHDDADTWMDAREKGVKPFSPRGNRANDIQSLWYQQLISSAYFANYMHDNANEAKWKSMAEKVKESFKKDFFDDKYRYMADRISTDGTKDFKLRPNQLYAYELLDNEKKKMEITKQVWSGLVYPWGVASLSQNDEDFHPYHENWHYYHKDEAYHNGTVWLWNNGMAMQRMIENNAVEQAYMLFKNMNKRALEEGAVGSLSENTDAIPREGSKMGKLSGTFLQAWSNAEHIRVWYQYFLGIRPNMLSEEITIEPKIPSEIKKLEYTISIGKGTLKCRYVKNKLYEYVSDNINSKISFILPEYESITIDIHNDEKLSVKFLSKKLNISLSDKEDKEIKSFIVSQDKQRVLKYNKQKAFFKNVDFCKPVLKKGLKSLSTYHEKALEY